MSSLYKFMNISYCFVLNILRIKKYQVIFVHSKSTNYLSIQLPNLPLLKGVLKGSTPTASYRQWRAMKRQLPTTTQPQPLTPKNTLFSSYCLLSHVFLIISPLSFSFWLLSSFLSIVLSLEQCFIFLSLYLLPLKLFIFGFSDFFAAEAQNQFSEITFSTF